MKQVRGVWLPEHEEHLVRLLDHARNTVNGLPEYQYDKLLSAVGYVRNWNVAVDVGAHVGLWSMHLNRRFKHLLAFEPVEANREAWLANFAGRREYENGHPVLHHAALGEHRDIVSMDVELGCSGNAFVAKGGDISMYRLDDFNLEAVDFLKLDCVGYELHVLRGSEATLLRCKPCVCVEQKPGRAQRFGLPETGAVDYLQELGAVLRLNMNGVYVLSWDLPQ